MDNDFDNNENTDPNFGTQLATTYAQSAAISAATMVVMLGVGVVINKVRDYREKKTQALWNPPYIEKEIPAQD